MQYRFGLKQDEINALNDDEYIAIAAKARYIDLHEENILKQAISKVLNGTK